MMKPDLQKHAQPLSDQSFSLKNAHSEFYTAWSSVRLAILIEIKIKNKRIRKCGDLYLKSSSVFRKIKYF